MIKRFKEWASIQLAKNPGKMVLVGILAFNIIFFIAAALVISALSLSGTEHMGFLEAAYYTITMILDAGCIEAVVSDIGTVGVATAITCLVIILIGMITFTGAVIGYITNFISDFIGHANTGVHRLKISNHTVILNWNNRASEIVNDLLYSENKEKVVVLVNSRKDEIKKEIEERLSETITKEKAQLQKHTKDMPYFQKRQYIRKHKVKWNVTFLVREGDIFSLKQLKDIQLEKAKAVIILGNDINNSICKFENKVMSDEHNRGNSQTIKTLMQVADITAAADSADNQKIIVEITDPWTQDIVNKIIRSKQVEGKCNIVPVLVNRILGQILSQFSLMPELNSVYKELFSNKGAAFYAEQMKVQNNDAFIEDYLKRHRHAIPLGSLTKETSTDTSEKTSYFFFVSDSEKNIKKTAHIDDSDYSVQVNPDYWLEKKNVIVLGHNSDSAEIMEGFAAFREEWNRSDADEEILRVTIVDDKEHLEKMHYYRQYPFVAETVVADIYDKEKICDTINRVITYSDEDTSVLILSDDSVVNESIDSKALANLIYVQDIIRDKIDANPNFDVGSIDIVVEILDPKHHDIVNSYDINNVVISNRYISKMITQIGEKDAIYDFYNDILTYDIDTTDGFDSKELYIKKVSAFFTEVPKPCKADEFIRAVYEETSAVAQKTMCITPSLMLGYVKKTGEVVIFSGDLSQIDVALEKDDKVIVYCAH